MQDIINYIREKQKEYREDSSGYKVLRHLEVVLPSLFAQPEPVVSEKADFFFRKYSQTFIGNGDYCFEWIDKERLKIILTEFAHQERQQSRQEAIQECIDKTQEFFDENQNSGWPKKEVKELLESLKKKAT